GPYTGMPTTPKKKPELRRATLQ
nr:3B [Rhinovirus C]